METEKNAHGNTTEGNGLVQDYSSKPTALVMIGMAGSGKSSLLARINSYFSMKKKKRYTINLDPAIIGDLAFKANVDIRDTVHYSQVMKSYKLGPNGAILTCLNLFTTKFDQVLQLVDKRADKQEGKKGLDYLLIDTPGQIEIFTWSASGAIITDAISSGYPTVVVYVIDTPRSISPTTFMSNMLYACSILYKTRLPFLLAFNKTDVVDWSFCKAWMADYEVFQSALDDEKADEQSYMDTLVSSMCLVLEEFYGNIKCVGVSAATGEGMEEFEKAVGECRQEWVDEYIGAARKKALLDSEKRRMKEDVDDDAAAALAHQEEEQEEVGNEVPQSAKREDESFASSSSSLLSSNTSEEDDLHNTQEWQEMGVIPKDYIIPHQLTTGAGGVPGGSLAETAASDEEEDYEGFGVANPDGSEKKSSADQGDDQEVKSSVYAPLVVEKTVIKADKSKMEEANRFAEQQRVPSEASKNRKKKAAKEKEEKEKEEKEKAEAAALKEELAGDDFEGEAEEKLHAKLKNPNQPLVLLSKDEAESPTALQVSEKMPKDVASDDEPESSADKAKSNTSSSKAGAKASLAKSAAPATENRYREDGSSLPTPPPNSNFESFANRVEASSSDAFAAATLVEDPVASEKKAGEDEKDSAPLSEDDSATIEDGSSLSAEGAHRASVLKKVVTKDSAPTNPPTTSAGVKSIDKTSPFSAENGANTEKQEESRVIDDHVRESMSRSNNLLDSFIEHPKPAHDTEDAFDELEEMNQFDFSEQPPIRDDAETDEMDHAA